MQYHDKTHIFAPFDDGSTVQILGSVAAGFPSPADDYLEEQLNLHQHLIKHPSATFFVRVSGDSMTGAHILDGDTVFLTPRDPRPGAIVAALIDGESTLKRFLVQRGRPFLRAENPRYPDLLPATELIIQGVMVGLLRQQPAA